MDFECLTLQNISKMDINQDFAQKYLEYLVNLIRLNKPIDFIQAALVMQTLSSVFAKKVDSLQEQILAFTIIFRKLELENNVEEDCGENGDGNERARSQRRKNVDKGIIMHSFENVCISNNIRKNTIRKWNEKDIRRMDPYSIRNKLNECPKIKTKDVVSCYMYDNKLDKLGKKEEFGINGILCNDLIPKDGFCLSCSHVQDFQQSNETMNVSLFPVLAPTILAQEEAVDHEPMLSPVPNSDRHSYQEVVEEFLNTSENTSSHIYFEKMNQVQEKLIDVDGLFNIMWMPVCDDNKLLERKIKKRNVLAVPEDLKKTQVEDERKYRVPYPSEYVLSDIVLALFKVKSNVPLHPHFTKSLRVEHEFRNKEQAKKRPRRTKTAIIANLRNDVDGFKGFTAFGEDEGDVNTFERNYDIEMPGDNDDDDDNLNIPTNEVCVDAAFQQVRGELQQGSCQNQHDETVNDIAVKVSSWHDSIRPHLEKEEKRTNFDIHDYGSKILNQFPNNNAKTTLAFATCVQNQLREEIPRYFLSSLLLANTMNVEISRDGQDELEVNDMMLTLLSRVRHHEELDEGLRKELS